MEKQIFLLRTICADLWKLMYGMVPTSIYNFLSLQNISLQCLWTERNAMKSCFSNISYTIHFSPFSAFPSKTIHYLMQLIIISLPICVAPKIIETNSRFPNRYYILKRSHNFFINDKVKWIIRQCGRNQKTSRFHLYLNIRSWSINFSSNNKSERRYKWCRQL